MKSWENREDNKIESQDDTKDTVNIGIGNENFLLNI